MERPVICASPQDTMSEDYRPPECNTCHGRAVRKDLILMSVTRCTLHPYHVHDLVSQSGWRQPVVSENKYKSD